MTKYFTETWKPATSLVKHMWRFYLSHQNDNPDDMSAVLRNAWAACDIVWKRLSDHEKTVLYEYHSLPRGAEYGEKLRELAGNLSMSVAKVMEIIDRTNRAAAIERGLADR